MSMFCFVFIYFISSCINGYLKSKTRILITHQIHNLETADNILILKDGLVVAQGTYNELKNLSNNNWLQFNDKEREEEEGEEEEEVDNQSTTSKDDKNKYTLEDDDLKETNNAKINQELSAELVAKQKLIQIERQESQKTGAVSYSTYITYLTSGGKSFGTLIMIFLFVVAQVLMIITDYYLIFWSRNEMKHSKELKVLQLCYNNYNSTNLNETVECKHLMKWTVDNYIQHHFDINHHSKRREQFNIYLSNFFYSFLFIINPWTPNILLK
jgi:hypothetical protein